jgi:hypothetical protein
MVNEVKFCVSIGYCKHLLVVFHLLQNSPSESAMPDPSGIGPSSVETAQPDPSNELPMQNDDSLLGTILQYIYWSCNLTSWLVLGTS